MDINDRKPPYLAHSARNGSIPEEIRQHQLNVTALIEEFSKHLAATAEAKLAGMAHDLGKYGDLFQRRLEGKEMGIDHWSLGAWLLLTQYREKAIGAALAVQGHHIGLQQGTKDALARLNPAKLQANHPFGLRLSESDLRILLQRLLADGVVLPEANDLPPSILDFKATCAEPAAQMLNVRMLYSALVDADYSATEAFYESKVPGVPNFRPPGLDLKPAEALQALILYVKGLYGREQSSEVAKMRRDVGKACLDIAEDDPGLFTLTAPTGSGKTLAMLAFALRHAEKHGLRRVVCVLPYLNILEQTVSEYRKAFTSMMDGDKLDRYVLEHHSLAGTRPQADEADGEDGKKRRYLSENWDAPIIITTSVQMLESLFASQGPPCRKLHRLAKSVLLFDEVQTLPLGLAIPTLATLSQLSARFGSTVLFSTATQPAFNMLDGKVRTMALSGWTPKEIIPKEMNLFKMAPRFRCHWPEKGQEGLEKLPWDKLAEEMLNAPNRQAMCVVNLKKHALHLHDLLKIGGAKGIFHLSTSMCGLHRKDRLDAIRAALKHGNPCLLVATQCVEAGVDLDFPAVWRAWGPLDSIAQAAGRCNRHGLMAEGTMTVFHPEEEGYPDHGYERAAAVARMIFAQYGAEAMDLSDTALFEKYYRDLYGVKPLDSLNEELQEAIKNIDFAETSRRFHVIEKPAINVLLPYYKDEYERLKNEAKWGKPGRAWIHRARPHSVSLFKPRQNDPVLPYLEPVSALAADCGEEWYIYLEPKHYDMETGLRPPKETQCLIA